MNVVTSNLVLRDKGLISLARIREATRTTSASTRRARLRVQATKPKTVAGRDARRMLLVAAKRREAALVALQAWAIPKVRSSVRLQRKRAQFDLLWSAAAMQTRQATDVLQAARLAANMEPGAEDLFR
jgi:hypothetical protein